jgi:hypothetical protein
MLIVLHTFSFSLAAFFKAPLEGPFSPSAAGASLGVSVTGTTFSVALSDIVCRWLWTILSGSLFAGKIYINGGV